MTDLLAVTLARVPAAHHGPLVPGPDDLRVLATLWWCSVSDRYVVAAAASLLATSRALSPRVDDVTLHRLPDSRVTGGTSGVELIGEDPVTALGAAIRVTSSDVLPRVAEAGQMRERPLWAIATDALGNRFLWAGRAVGLDASPTATAVAAAVGVPLAPNWAPADSPAAPRAACSPRPRAGPRVARARAEPPPTATGGSR
ncbi:hypothetical protein [Klenkia terrae]|uniref:Uncharacterized protein n=1 Tax=Klenkia terrae TaxID=1052259 RepID=A0ABU8E1H2_9ACTN|nr:hypothetical protein [Klenkia terrae]SSC22627.1 Hypothetical protein KLENKIAIHU_1216 [Klenkia terrae]